MPAFRIKDHLTRRNLVNLGALLIIVYMSVATLQVISKNFKLQQEVDSLADEISFLHLKNQELEYKVAYYQTDSFADREARDKLGLQAPGEKVVIFPDKVPPLTVSAASRQPNKPRVQQAISNLEQWLYFLFRKDPN